jgi:hypothetical protein
VDVQDCRGALPRSLVGEKRLERDDELRVVCGIVFEKGAQDMLDDAVRIAQSMWKKR